MKIGIVGLPNVGKSTLFQALTKKQVDTSNYPFATIDPNIGVVEIPDERLEKLSKLSNSKKIVPAIVEFVDIAGLVKGAAEGEGLGNKFLTHIREVDAICHVVRAFLNENITHVAGTPNPQSDWEIVRTELELKDLDSKETINLLSKKPELVIFNISGKNVQTPNIPHSLAIDIGQEYDISNMSESERAELGVSSQLPEFIRAAYSLLNLITFFTTGEDESRAWTIPASSSAKRAGRAIHSDFEEKFIRADVIFWQKLLEADSWSKARDLGWIRSEGKEYTVQDGDVIEFKI
ncbi:MAG TPA: redox-regulated ATPase YchF [Candidatus Paceibacterota bacterium]